MTSDPKEKPANNHSLRLLASQTLVVIVIIPVHRVPEVPILPAWIKLFNQLVHPRAELMEYFQAVVEIG